LPFRFTEKAKGNTVPALDRQGDVRALPARKCAPRLQDRFPRAV